MLDTCPVGDGRSEKARPSPRGATSAVERPEGVHRRAARNGALVRLVAAQFLGGAAEWAVIIALLVHAFERGGARATGLTSLASFSAPLIAGPLIAIASGRYPLQSIRRAGLLLCTFGSIAAGAAVLVELPILVVVTCGVFALSGLTVLAATGSSLVPAAVHTPRELVIANLWLGHSAALCVLIGPLFVSVMLALGGPTTALIGCGVLSLSALLLTAVGAGPPATDLTVRPVRDAAAAARALIRRPGGVGLVGVSFARQIMLGALDVLIVVIAFQTIDLGGTGAALMNAAFGAGAVLSMFATTLALRGTRLALPILAGLGSAAGMCVLLAATLTVAPTFVILVSLGLSAAVVHTLSRMLLQRSADPRSLGQVFGFVALTDGIGLLVGSLLAQVVLAAWSIEAALVAVGATLAVIAVASLRSLWRADASADIPVVEMSLLRNTSIFGSLTPFELEPLARAAIYIEVEAASVVIRQGDPGDCFYVVAAGAFDVEMSGKHIRTIERGQGFGEVALLADVTRTATVTASRRGVLLSIDRVAFLIALTGSDTSKQAAWGAIRAMVLEGSVGPSVS